MKYVLSIPAPLLPPPCLNFSTVGSCIRIVTLALNQPTNWNIWTAAAIVSAVQLQCYRLSQRESHGDRDPLYF
jgi:hypothetical protein